MAEVQVNFATLDVDIQNSLITDNQTTSHTVGADTDIMLVVISLPDDNSITIANWNSIAMTNFIDFYPNITAAHRIAVYYVIAPTGTHDVDVTMAGNGRFVTTIIDLAGVNQENPFNVDSLYTQSVDGAGPDPGIGHVETGTTQPTRIRSRFIIDFVLVGGGSSGYTATAPPFEDGGDNSQILLDGRGTGDTNGTVAAGTTGSSYKAGTLGREIKTHMGWEHNIYGANRQWAYVAFTMNPGEEEIEFIGGPLGLTDHLQLPSRVTRM